jgi:D-glycero-alpha-D-manno-heptose 1-phosphate guanylyltransferase
MSDPCGTLSEVTAAILIGGLGTRLRSVVSDRPKVLAEIQGRPFLAFLMDQLTAAGIKRAVLCAGYKGEQVQSVFGHSYGGLDLLYSQEASPLGTGGAIRFAIDLLRSDPILVMNGDSFCEVDLNAFYTWHCAREANATLLLTQLSNTKRYGRVHVDADGLVFGFDEKDDKSGPGWINAGIYLIKHSLLLTIPDSGARSLEREMFPAWIGQGLYGYKCEGRFLDIGTPEAYVEAEQFFSPEMLI